MINQLELWQFIAQLLCCLFHIKQGWQGLGEPPRWKWQHCCEMKWLFYSSSRICKRQPLVTCMEALRPNKSILNKVITPTQEEEGCVIATACLFLALAFCATTAWLDYQQKNLGKALPIRSQSHVKGSEEERPRIQGGRDFTDIFYCRQRKLRTLYQLHPRASWGVTHIRWHCFLSLIISNTRKYYQSAFLKNTN